MSTPRTEWKVGIFVLVSLSLLAGLILKFSKNSSLLVKTYSLHLVTSNVGGIREGAVVLMAGVQVGHVQKIELTQSGKVVTIRVQILSRYTIHGDASFSIQQAGFLGDQFVSIVPAENEKPPLKDGDQVNCEEPFNLLEMARSAAGLLRRVDQTAQRLDDAVARIDRTLLAERTLTNLTSAVENFRDASGKALDTLDRINQLVETNSHPLSLTISNLSAFSSELTGVAEELKTTVATNRVEVTKAIGNIESATVKVNQIMADLQQGKGLAGSILKNEELERSFRETIDNVNMLSSNLNKFGLLYKPKIKKTNVITRSLYPGKDPSR